MATPRHFEAESSEDAMTDDAHTVRLGVESQCSFCGKTRAEVRKLIHAGDSSIAICDECVELCQRIISGEFDGPSPEKQSRGL